MRLEVPLKGNPVQTSGQPATSSTAEAAVDLVKSDATSIQVGAVEPATAEPIATAVVARTGVSVLDAGHTYMVTGGQKIQFIKRTAGVLVSEGTTNEELLQVLINRTRFLNDKFPCRENSIAIQKMEETLMWFNERTAKRIEQGVETLDIAHEDVATQSV